MTDLRSKVRAILPFVQEPIQYVGGEWNSIVKDHSAVDVTVALAFPDTYAIGMSHLGLQILYSILNARPDVAAERVYAPWTDMEARMRKAGIPLYALESFTPVRDFDILGFSLQHEMCYTNVLNMLDLAGIPLRSAERSEEHPLVIAGGPCAITPEPVADFIDLFLLGDGEERIVDLVAAYKRLKQADPQMPRKMLIAELTKSVPSLYVPELYNVEHNPDGTVRSIRPSAPGIPDTVRAAVVKDLDAAPYPTAPVVPFLETVHDRISLEIMRGCTHGCRFCQAGMMKRPSRARTIPTLLKLAEETYRHTG
ncbi:MAG: B12-binding domain-containing radical SAM protein, partial [Planctomycetes bacterium]|nr:B12-binding domain-containing radical SAM protein [Planctomycetota bacterium]